MMNTASSMTAISTKGSDRLFSTSAMITKMATMDTALTTWKSWPVVSIISFMQGASPISMPVSSYFFKMAFRLSSWSLTASLATLYSELMSSSSHWSFSSIERTESGRISSGTSGPTTLSSPSTYFTPSTCSISSIMSRTSRVGRSASISSMWVEEMSKSSASLELAMT